MQKTLEKFLLASWLLIIVLIPFHALLSTWGGSTIGPLEVWKSWKEILLAIDIPIALAYLARRGQLKRFFADKLVWLILLYAVLHVLLWAWLRPPAKAALVGILMNLRFFGIFLLAMVLTTFVDRQRLLRQTTLAVSMTATLVLVFGLLQLVLPHDFLAHFGYSSQTIAPATTLDNNASIIRLQSTLRGPNPLGQYLVMIAVLLLALLRLRRKWLVAVLGSMLLVVIALTYSRSAWLGLLVAGGCWIWLGVSNSKLRRRLLQGGLLSAVVIAGLLAVILPHSIALQNTLLHNKQHDTDAGSTVVHYTAQVDALKVIAHHPFGQGPGTFGPASFYAPVAHIPENYYLQIAGEVGIVGLLVFIAIVLLTASRLWPQRHQFWPKILLVSLAALSVVNLMLHGWADDTTALLWWGIAGLFCAPRLLTKNNKNANV